MGKISKFYSITGLGNGKAMINPAAKKDIYYLVWRPLQNKWNWQFQRKET